MGIRAKLKAPDNLQIDFAPSSRQYEVWKNVQPECNKCGGEVGMVRQDDGTDEAVCLTCKNMNIPQMTLSGGAAGGG